MAGRGVTQATVPGVASSGSGGGGGGGGGGRGGEASPNNGINASHVNSFRISAVIDCLALHVRSHLKGDAVEFLNLCLSLARGIDFSIANHEVPIRAQELPSLVKQKVLLLPSDYSDNGSRISSRYRLLVARYSTALWLEYGYMELPALEFHWMLNACQSGWFSDRDSEELINLTKEIANNFGSVSHFNAEPVCSVSVISTIMSRFYPRMKMGHMFVFLEVKPGFDAYVSDFQISKNLKSSPGDKIGTETAEYCLFTLTIFQDLLIMIINGYVIFLILDAMNMRGYLLLKQTVSRHLPASLAPKVNFLLNGKAVEKRSSLFMDTGPQIPTAVTHFLKYGSNLLQAVGEFNGNYLVVVAIMSEMPNADSNALQDYEQHAPSTVDSDSEIIEGPSRISLNCPISFRRIRTPVKGHSCKHIQVLKEVEANVSDIIFSSDGSWQAVMKSDDVIQKPEKKTSTTGNNDSPEPVGLLDLTQTDDAMDNTTTCETEDRKLSQTACQSQSVTQTMAVNSLIANTNYVNPSSTDIEHDFWSGVYLSTFGLASSNFRANELVAAVSVSTSNFIPSPPGLTDSFVSPNGEVEAFPGNSLMPASVPQSEASLPNTLQLQQCQLGNATITNEYGRLQAIRRHVTRIPSAVQALPAQDSSSVLQQMSRDNVDALVHNGLSAASHASPTSPMISNPVLHSSSLKLSQMSSSPLHHYPRIQQTRPFPYVSPPQQNIVLQASGQVPNAPRVLNPRSSQQMTNFRMPRSMSQSLGTNISSIQSPTGLLRPQSDVGVSQDRIVHTTELVSGQHSSRTALADRTMAVDTSRAAPYSTNPDRRMPSVGDQRSNFGIASQPSTSTGAYDRADQNWRPAVRMRGALSGQAYTNALNQYVIRPNQQAQVARPTSNVTSVPDNVPAPNYPSPRPGSRPGGLDSLPNRSSEMQ
ncbi:E4 SUMO-protein ligase PIAL2 [Sesamum angolense]|uniref:E4 SUMO-protein ligase PIAL2 n=1 Tax=Sesamum angolense TaxID=2727404 RepID=A0AAE2BL15_9LAMI|nr:E4 SUMO-protein ligase PIAL2 [Sesamum angolense]